MYILTHKSKYPNSQTDFMQLGGLSPARSFDATVGMSGLMVVGNMCGWFFVEKFGRRNTALYGVGVLCVALFVIGILACIETSGAIWGQVVFMGIWSFGEYKIPLCSNLTDTAQQSTRALSAQRLGQSAQKTRRRACEPPRNPSQL